MTASPFERACNELKSLGIILRKGQGEYRVNFRRGPPATDYVTDDLNDAIARGREMASTRPPATELPLGPIGHSRSHRSRMYHHNRKIAAGRRKRGDKNT